MKYQIQIPKPCNEKWHNMTPTERGAFCDMCQKEVFDFTRTSKFELGKMIHNNQKICGKFRPEQLNTPISYRSEKSFSRIGSFLGFASLLALTTPAFSQTTNHGIEKIDKSCEHITIKEFPQSVQDSITISGIVKDEFGTLPGASIIVNKTKYGAITDFDGNFSFRIPEELLKKKQKLKASFIGFIPKEITLKQKKGYQDIKLDIFMDGETVLMGEVVITEYKH